MKKLLMVGFICFAGGFAQAQVQQCYTTSNGYNFVGSSQKAVIDYCKSHPNTKKQECKANAYCSAVASYNCSTKSNGYEFFGKNAGQAISQCVQHPYTNKKACEKNVVCNGNGNGNGQNLTQAEKCYLKRYPDICQNSPTNYCLNPTKHWLEHGMSELRLWGCGNPSLTPGQCYLKRYPDICQNSAVFCKNPEAHYQQHGIQEGRIWGCK
ncbi:MAG: hypothetical protein V4736_05435 [Bdellovibrionota bacterium]